MAAICAVILCGGKGTRLRNAVSDRPKPMAEVGGRPFLEILIKQLERNGIRRVILSTGYMSGYIRKYFRDRKYRAKVLISEEKRPLGTAGGLKLAGRLITGRDFFVLNGDSYCGASLKSMLAYHRRKKASATVLLSERGRSPDTGCVKLDSEQRITGFSEKTCGSGPALVNAGVYVFGRGILRAIPAGRKSSLEYDVFPKLKGFFGCRTSRDFIDIGTARRYVKANKDFRKIFR